MNNKIVARFADGRALKDAFHVAAGAGHRDAGGLPAPFLMKPGH